MKESEFPHLNLSKTFDECDDDEEVVQTFFSNIDVNKDGKVSSDEIRFALGRFNDSTNAQKLEALLRKLDENSEYSHEMSLTSFRNFIREFKLPRIHGQRIQWARSLGLDCVLARHLKVGDLFDQLSGIKAMTESELQQALDLFASDVRVILHGELWKLKNVGSMSEQAKAVMSKFTGGFTGRFGDSNTFQGGLEREIGIPDPAILKGIFRENMSETGSKNQFRTSSLRDCLEILLSMLPETRFLRFCARLQTRAQGWGQRLRNCMN
jgi:hypothetical protein